MFAYVHPFTAALTALFLAYVSWLGLRSRTDRRYGRRLLMRHARLAPIMYGLVLVSWGGGFLSTWLVRHDMELAGTAHFRVGVALVLALSGSVLTSRWIDRPRIRAIHPWFGAAAVLLAATQVFFGLQITP